LRGAVEQLQEVKERMEEERDEFLEDLVANGEVVDGESFGSLFDSSLAVSRRVGLLQLTPRSPRSFVRFSRFCR